MSILTQLSTEKIGVEIDRIKAAKTDIKTSITNKGVTVPAETKIDGMSVYIDAIDTSENLDEVLTEQESIIDQIQAALEGKAAGGTAVETCTIKLYTYSTGMQPVGVCQIYTSDGIAVKEISEHYEKEYTSSFGWVYILENVVCGSVLMLTDESGSVTSSPYIEGTAVVVSTSPLDDAWGIKAPSTKDEICVLDFN